MKRISTVLCGWILLTGLIYAQQKEIRVLFVGNSYTYENNLAHIVSRISEGTSTLLITRKSVIGGADLREHWDGGRALQTRRMIAEGNFDAVILQDFSMAAINNPDSLLKYVRLFTEFNRICGARTYLFNTWAREKVPQYQAEIDAIYRQAAEENHVVRVPVGPAWELALRLRPAVDLYNSDGSHPNELGTLLTASVIVRCLTGELPEILPALYQIEDAFGETVRLMNHNPEDVEFCRRIALQICDESALTK
jgi:hypothetical protein